MRGGVQHSKHPVSRVDAAAVFIQQREDVFVQQVDHIRLFVRVVYHPTLQKRRNGQSDVESAVAQDVISCTCLLLCWSKPYPRLKFQQDQQNNHQHRLPIGQKPDSCSVSVWENLLTVQATDTSITTTVSFCLKNREARTISTGMPSTCRQTSRATSVFYHLTYVT